VSDSLGIYFHVPFCRTRCRYCDFYRVGENRERMTEFRVAVAAEIEGWRALHGRAVETIFFGGGTPSLLEPEEIGGLISGIDRHFRLAGDVEISAEANPSDLTPERLRALRAAGVNRLSIGIQSFVDRELSLLGRRHDAAHASRVVHEAAETGFGRLSIDLMVGIPGQTDGSFAASLARAVALPCEHMSLYLLEVHAGSELDFLRRERPRLFAGEEASRRRYLRMREVLRAAGFEHYEISNFARPGGECRHNLRYWHCRDWLGLGPSAHSFVDGRRFRHPANLQAWLADPMAVESVAAEPALERVFLGLRLAEGIEERWIEEAGIPMRAIGERLERLRPFFEREDGRLRLTPEGFLVSNAVLAELLS
jgi:oxygen-independent coproporphyrinogen-3 oxidase